MRPMSAELGFLVMVREPRSSTAACTSGGHARSARMAPSSRLFSRTKNSTSSREATAPDNGGRTSTNTHRTVTTPIIPSPLRVTDTAHDRGARVHAIGQGPSLEHVGLHHGQLRAQASGRVVVEPVLLDEDINSLHQSRARGRGVGRGVRSQGELRVAHATDHGGTGVDAVVHGAPVEDGALDLRRLDLEGPGGCLVQTILLDKLLHLDRKICVGPAASSVAVRAACRSPTAFENHLVHQLFSRLVNAAHDGRAWVQAVLQCASAEDRHLDLPALRAERLLRRGIQRGGLNEALQLGGALSGPHNRAHRRAHRQTQRGQRGCRKRLHQHCRQLHHRHLHHRRKLHHRHLHLHLLLQQRLPLHRPDGHLAGAHGCASLSEAAHD
mmetsp:Transcript_71576/g.192751  ORF Transcript_71576/g.192751 Transcript_71576/m.192751 type:complete len:383 (+) Transcript_71576:130-1278(+)